MSHATDETEKFREVGEAEKMRLWGAYLAVANGLWGDAEKAESICEMLAAVGVRQQTPAEQREAFEKLFFGSGHE